MKRYKKIPDMSQENGFLYTEPVYIAFSVNNLRTMGAGFVITEENLEQKNDYLSAVNVNGKIGFINSFGDIIIKPQYDNVSANFITENSFVCIRKGDKLGLIDADGIEIVECIYRKLSIYKSQYIVVQNFSYNYAIIEFTTKNIIVPFGKYFPIEIKREHLEVGLKGKKGIIDLQENILIPFRYRWISTFNNGFARVIIYDEATSKEKWGIIDLKGNIVVPTIYDRINVNMTYAIKGGECINLHLFHNSLNKNTIYSGRERTYNEYNGSEAQDVEGYDDETISDAFEGDPDAYWNID